MYCNSILLGIITTRKNPEEIYPKAEKLFETFVNYRYYHKYFTTTPVSVDRLNWKVTTLKEIETEWNEMVYEKPMTASQKKNFRKTKKYSINASAIMNQSKEDYEEIQRKKFLCQGITQVCAL